LAPTPATPGTTLGSAAPSGAGVAAAPKPPTPDAFIAAVHRIHRAIESAIEVDQALLPPRVLADVEIILELAPHAVPLDVPANLDALRWLYIAAQLYSRPARRPVVEARRRRDCSRCGGELVPMPRGDMLCTRCGGLE